MKNVMGIVVLIAMLSLGLMACGKNRNETDKDELKDSEYITGTSDKFDDTDADTNLPFEYSKEGKDSSNASNSKESDADKKTDSANSTTNDAEDEKTENSDGNSNSTEEDKQPESEKEDDKEEDKKEEVNKEDEGWTGFY